jgi:NAD(P)-dependent dehydrogenase (short-subunit alcohol dehydrogenase family)
MVTGVGPGLGASLARRFAREGFSVGLVARHSTFIDDLAREIAKITWQRLIGISPASVRPPGRWSWICVRTGKNSSSDPKGTPDDLSNA